MDWITGARPSGVLSTVGVVVAVLLVFMAIWRLVLRLMKDRDLAEGLRVYLRWPARAVVALGALLLALPGARLPHVLHGRVFHLLLLALVAAAAWLAVWCASPRTRSCGATTWRFPTTCEHAARAPRSRCLGGS
jgi:hypothetical protein